MEPGILPMKLFVCRVRSSKPVSDPIDIGMDPTIVLLYMNMEQGNIKWAKDKGQGTRDKGQGTRDKGQGTRASLVRQHA
jgi:hypothetical protein